VLRFLVILLAPAALMGQRWSVTRSGPFEVYTAAGAKAGREMLADLEQFRHALAEVIGKPEITPVWPVRVMLFDSAHDARGYPTGSLKLRRDGWITALVKNQRPPFAGLTRILLESGAGPLPEWVEQGLAAVLATLKIERTRVTLGAPPPEPERTPEWVKMHLLAVTPEFAGRLRVLISNLEQGADWVAAYRNAFEKTPQQIEEEADNYRRAGLFGTRKLTGAPIDAERDYRVRDGDPALVATLLADLLDGEAAQAAYRAVLNQYGQSPGALEGLELYEEAVAAGSTSARCHYEYAMRVRDPGKARAAFEKAAALNPRWGEPVFRLAALVDAAAEKIALLKKATALEPRNASYWEALAEAALAAGDFAEAGKAWAAAERAARNPAERERLRIARRRVETERADRAEAERRRQQEEIERLKQKMLQNIREAEERVSRREAGAPPPGKAVEWWDDPRPKGKVEGLLERVDCLGAQARVAIRSSGGQTVALLIRDPSQVVILGGGEQALGCGPQRPPRTVMVEYVTQADAKLKTSGEVIVIEFR
jgi:tetratricopeptide (TPR) repeat protein